MDSHLIETKSKFSFHLDGSNEIDSVVLVNAINDITELTKIAVNSENPEAYLKLKVTAFKNGSFEIDFSAICQQVKTLFDTAVPLAATAVGTVKGYFEIKKLLKGKAPKSIVDSGDDKIIVEGHDNAKVVVNKASGDIVNNIKIDRYVTNISLYAQEHTPDGGFTFTHEGEEDLYCSSEDLINMETPLPIEASSSLCRRWTINTCLFIKKPDILGKSKWGFRYNGKNIDATILDDNFIEYIHGVALKTGDYIDVTLEMEVDLDKNGNPIDGTEKYAVLEVHGGIWHSDKNEQLF